jgi:hypothetical protein
MAVLARITLLVFAAVVPVLLRKVISGPSAQDPAPSSFFQIIARLDSIDYVLATMAVAAVFIPRILDAIDRRKQPTKRLPSYDLSAAIDRNARGRDGSSERAITDAIDSVLRALRDEMAELIDETGRDRITDVTLFEFCDAKGAQMQVRGRTAKKDPNGRPVPSAKLMAYPVAVAGQPFIENDFLSPSNPYPKTRVTVANAPRVTYRSILFLPILWSAVDETANTDDPALAPRAASPVDMVIGIVCINCAKPYRFWRWGDHRRPGGAFESIAYERALPYIALLTKLLEPTAHKVRLEVA